jgi:hypothetical protein
MLDALAAMYDAAAPSAATGAAATPVASAAAPASPAVSVDEAKEALMALVKADNGQRTRVDAIIVKHCGSLIKKVADIPFDKLPGITADAKAALAAPATSAAEDL